MTFYNYLMRHRAPVEKDDATRLANLVFQDPLFPKQSKDFDEISTYLEPKPHFTLILPCLIIFGKVI